MKSSPFPPISDIQSIAQSPLVRRLLDGNLAPSDEERTLLTACRKSSRVRLASIKESIEDMKAQLAVMTQDASQLSQDLEVLDLVLHPVRSLPHEIIDHICQLAMEDLQSPSLEALAAPDIIDSLAMRHPLWTCAQVCHRWRHVIWNNPRCWTTVVLTFHKSMTPFRLSLLLIDVLSRTQGLPLSIAIHSRTPIPFLAMPIILQSCSRWQHATLSLTTKDFRLLSEMKHAFGELRTLQLHLHEPPQSLEQPIDAFSEARGVHSLQIVRDVTPYFDLGWLRIQRFTHQGHNHALSVQAARDILTRTSSVAFADLNLRAPYISGPFFGTPPSPANFIVGFLRTLILREYPAEGPGYRGSGIASFLRIVSLPNLASLSIDMQTVSPLGDLRGANSPSILKLSLSVATFQPEDSEALGKFLVYAPSVQHFALHVDDDVVLEWVFAAVAFAELPIHSMTFTAGGCMIISQTDGSSLAGDTFSSLWRKGIFKTLTIHRVSRVGDEVMATLKGLVEEGLVLDMRDVNGALWRLNGDD